ncbi:ABC transporter ATP-binding protein [Alphaproteobacteria bacterium]|jgi:peptide/nickel transport system ATP-binding protein/oligopeptide transport system ATP-binding protein|nr:ABC transporter ATP-binding protein [Alphaproteobacteria bacterium]
MATQTILEVRDLTVELATRDGISPVIDGLSFEVGAGETLALVGESGCGKSMTALAVMGLVPHPIGRIAGGEIRFGSEDLVAVGEDRLRDIRGNDISMIFQEPMTSLNPVYSVGEQIAEVLRRHQGLNQKQAWQHAVELLHAVGIPDAAARVSTYPHQMSGGQRQRVMIAMALACKPKILIADEPTTALDVTVQAQIFDLLRVLQRETGTAIVLITHDMGAVCELAERMMVMYAGRKVEEGTVDDVIANPRHPYTQGLISCVPHVTDDPSAERVPLVEISGIVPALRDFGADQCLFAARCQQVVARCAAERPVSNDFGSGHRVACWQAEVGS